MSNIKCIDASDEKLIEYYEKLIESRRKEIVDSGRDYTDDDIILVRTTDIFPKDRVLEPLIMGKKTMKSNFEDLERVLVSRKIYPDKYSIPSDVSEKLCFETMVYRNTIHFTENGFVLSHAQGNFDNQPFIILEPLKEQIGHANFRLFAGQDTFVEGSITLSKNAIIMLPYDKSSDLLLEYPQLVDYQLLTYKGDQQQAVRMVLYDLGYLPEYISIGHLTGSDTSHLIMELNRRLAAQYNCVSNTKHAFTDEYKKEVDNRIKLYLIFERACVKFMINELVKDEIRKQKILNDLDTRIKNDTDALYNLDDYDPSILIETIEKFNQTVELMKENGELPYANEVLKSNSIDIYQYYLKYLNLHNYIK